MALAVCTLASRLSNDDIVKYIVQWTVLNWITDNGKNQWIESEFKRFTSAKYSEIPNIGWSSFTYWYHLVNGICYGLAQSDPIKRLLQYMSRNVPKFINIIKGIYQPMITISTMKEIVWIIFMYQDLITGIYLLMILVITRYKF